MAVKILITFALETEFAPWRRLRSFGSVAGMAFPAYESAIGDAGARVVLTGVGPVPAKRVAAEALKWKPDVCISSGLAGALRSELRIGEVFVTRSVRELETGRKIDCNAELFATAQKRGVAGVEHLLSMSTMVLTAEGKARLCGMADAVDMESFAILSEASANSVPTIAIRAISDLADENLPMDFQAFLDEQGGLDRSKVARALAHAPHKLPGLIRLGRNSRRAAENIAKFLDAYVADIAKRSALQTELVEAYQK
jgi:adenosylhomocysteine nucleosidase